MSAQRPHLSSGRELAIGSTGVLDGAETFDLSPQLAALGHTLRSTLDYTGPQSIVDALDVVLDYFRRRNAVQDAPIDTTPSHSISQSPPRPFLPISDATVNQPITTAQNIYLNRQTTLAILYSYAANTIIDYPQTSEHGRIGHLFRLDPLSWERPDKVFAYSYGHPCGASSKKNHSLCPLLVDKDGNPVPCREYHATCQGCKVCPFANQQIASHSHTQASRDELRRQLDSERAVGASEADRVIFERTLAYFVALKKHGCLSPMHEATHYTEVERKEQAAWQSQVERGHRGHDVKRHCLGRILLAYDSTGSPFVRCEHYSRRGTRDHFIDYAVSRGIYDVQYLVALFQDDTEVIQSIEDVAGQSGFGPRSCQLAIANTSSVRVNCPNEHRDEQGNITLAEMQVLDCHSKIRVFEPLEDYRKTCPQVLVICSGEHSHLIPLPNKTPSSIRSEIFKLLRLLDYDLPDLTPRRFLRHPTTLAYLRQQLPDITNPMLMDLHPSLANRDHIRAYIKQVQDTLYPRGTGWDGLLAEKEKQDSNGLQYIRLAEEFNLPESDTDGDDDPSATDSSSPFRMVICMFPEASRRLARAQYLQCDIGFKRIVGFQEFELGGMDEESRTTIAYCRIYLNQQTASAHHLLFQKIDDIVKVDTGSSLRWRHLVAKDAKDISAGILQVTADQHGGQAKGLGLYLKALASQLPATRRDVHEPERLLSSLDEYDHLRRIFRLCAVHVQRNIQQAGVTDDVKEKMCSLICTYHYTWEDTIEYIRVTGGKAGSDWVQDKVRSKFAFPGICWSKSYIPLPVWRVGSSNSNIIEGLHADVNREGVACTLVGGMKKGLHYDTMKLRTLNVFTESGVRTSYDRGSVSDAASRTLKRMANKRHNNLASQDKAIEKRNKRLRTAHLTKTRAEIRLNQVATSSTSIAHVKSLHERADDSYKKAITASQEMVGKGSGKVGLLMPQGFASM